MQSLADSDFTKMLQDPFQEHQGLTVVTPTIFDLLCVFNQLPALVSTNGIGLPAAKNCVLHAAIFHILGGYGANLPPPPRTSAEARTPAFAITRTLFTEAARLEAKRASLAARAAKGAGGPEAAAAAQELAALLATPLDAKSCCLLRAAGDGTNPASRKRPSDAELLLAQRAPATGGKRVRLGPDPGFDLWRREEAEGSWASGSAFVQATTPRHHRDTIAVKAPAIDANTPGAWPRSEGWVSGLVRAIPTSDGRFWINGT